MGDILTGQRHDGHDAVVVNGDGEDLFASGAFLAVGIHDEFHGVSVLVGNAPSQVCGRNRVIVRIERAETSGRGVRLADTGNLNARLRAENRYHVFHRFAAVDGQLGVGGFAVGALALFRGDGILARRRGSSRNPAVRVNGNALIRGGYAPCNAACNGRIACITGDGGGRSARNHRRRIERDGSERLRGAGFVGSVQNQRGLIKLGGVASQRRPNRVHSLHCGAGDGNDAIFHRHAVRRLLPTPYKQGIVNRVSVLVIGDKRGGFRRRICGNRARQGRVLHSNGGDFYRGFSGGQRQFACQRLILSRYSRLNDVLSGLGAGVNCDNAVCVYAQFGCGDGGAALGFNRPLRYVGGAHAGRKFRGVRFALLHGDGRRYGIAFVIRHGQSLGRGRRRSALRGMNGQRRRAELRTRRGGDGENGVRCDGGPGGDRYRTVGGDVNAVDFRVERVKNRPTVRGLRRGAAGIRDGSGKLLRNGVRSRRRDGHFLPLRGRYRDGCYRQFADIQVERGQLAQRETLIGSVGDIASGGVERKRGISVRDAAFHLEREPRHDGLTVCRKGIGVARRERGHIHVIVVRVDIRRGHPAAGEVRAHLIGVVAEETIEFQFVLVIGKLRAERADCHGRSGVVLKTDGQHDDFARLGGRRRSRRSVIGRRTRRELLRVQDG